MVLGMLVDDAIVVAEQVNKEKENGLEGKEPAWVAIKKVWKPSEVVVEKTKQSVELCAIYWHFLLIVWLVLFILMLLT